MQKHTHVLVTTCTHRHTCIPTHLLNVLRTAEDAADKALDACGLPRHYLQTSHCFNDATHHTCCLLGPEVRLIYVTTTSCVCVCVCVCVQCMWVSRCASALFCSCLFMTLHTTLAAFSCMKGVACSWNDNRIYLHVCKSVLVHVPACVCV
jgi:hypothetical protein